MLKTKRLEKRYSICILSTGHGTNENQDKALSLGADAFLRKPSSKNKILECVENLLRGRRGN